MNLSIFAAQAIALLYLSVGVGMIFNPTYYKKFLTHLYEDMTALYVGACVAMLVGFALVSHHNIWVKDWRVLVTIVGWLAFIKGISLLAFPKTFQSLIQFLTKRTPKIMGIFVAILGLIFAYFGFFAT